MRLTLRQIPPELTKSGYLVPVAQFDSLQEVLVVTQLKAEMTQDELD